jgi:prolipoprotein diacylglyceryltransferase
VLLLIDRRRALRPGRLFVCYVAGYTFARFFIERIRVDPASLILGLRVNEWVSAILFLGAVGILVADRFRPAPAPGEDEQVRSDA